MDSYKMSHVQIKMDKYIKKREEIKDALDEKYNGKKASRAINSGSYAKHTAVNVKFDIDVCQPFLRSSFETLEAMADDVFDFFMNDYEDSELVKYKTKKQRVSVGLTFLIDGEEVGMDIVPSRELLEDDYKVTNRLNLHVRAKGTEPATSTQTNIQKHIELISGKGDEREIIRLLKVWNITKNSGKKLKSFFIELITIRACEDYSGEKLNGLWERLQMVMEFIRDEIESIQLKDPANSNNIVSNTLTATEKSNLSYDMKVMLDRISENDENLKVYFSVNDKFDNEDDESKIGASILSTKSFS
ncbi:MAG: hypothetical protein HC831_03865 [Chloroflexia bacterium]|nr:hypothetical protein [Chloroflexia bacterium]